MGKWMLVAVFSLVSQGALPLGLQAQEKTKALKVCLVSGSLEYESDKTLAIFQKYAEKNYHIECSRAFRKTDTDIPGLENLDKCDVMVLYTRRLTPSPDQLDRVKKYLQSGRPVVGIRTASHAFQNWLDLDREVLGGNYKGHFGKGSLTKIHIADGAKGHPILAGFMPFDSEGTLYKNKGLAKDCNVLLTGTIPNENEPIAWTRLNHGGRVFYTSLGHQQDFENDSFLRLIANALYWTTNREPQKR